MEPRTKAAKNQILISFKQKHESDIREDIFMVYSSSEKKKRQERHASSISLFQFQIYFAVSGGPW